MAEPKTTAVQTATPIAMGMKGVELSTLEDAYRFSQYVVKAKLAPQGMDAAGVLVAMQTGRELGFDPMVSLRSFPVINGRPSIEGQAAVALLYKHDVLDPRYGIDFGSELDEQGELYGWCRSWKRGWPEPRDTTFTWAQAKRAKLVGKRGPWQEYPEQMMMWRAVGFHCRKYYPEVLLGLYFTDEARDIPAAPRELNPAPDDKGAQAPDPLLAGLLDPVDAEVTIPQPPQEAVQEAAQSTDPAFAERDAWEREDWLPPAAETVDVGQSAPEQPELLKLELCGLEDPESEQQCRMRGGHEPPCDWMRDPETGDVFPPELGGPGA